VLAGLLSSFFGAVLSLLAARLSIGVAAASAFVVTVLAAYAAMKAALLAVGSGLAYVTSPALVATLAYFLPTNIASCFTAILLADTIYWSYDFWRQYIGAAFFLAKG